MGAVTRPWRAVATRLRPLLPDFRDLHVYGGGMLIAWGVAAYSPPAALIALGLVLLYLGLRKHP